MRPSRLDKTPDPQKESQTLGCSPHISHTPGAKLVRIESLDWHRTCTRGVVPAMAASISVIVPVYNSAGYLRTCLEHLRRSSLSDYECIVVDDGSTDASADVARQFGVTVLSTDKRRGPSFARNLGAKSAHADI